MGFHPGRRAYPISTNTSNSISNKKGWMVGTNATYGIGTPYNVNRFVCFFLLIYKLCDFCFFLLGNILHYRLVASLSLHLLL